MILTGNEINKQVINKNITIIPYTKKNITTNSYDLTLGEQYLFYTGKILDPAKENKFRIKSIPDEGLVLNKGDFILGHSIEIIGSDKYVPIIHAKSGIARLGLFVHITADLIDIGSKGNITFQLYATSKIRLYRGMHIGQVSFWVPKGKINLYKGKYFGSRGPQASKIHLDFAEKQLKKSL
jgi:dCTP deaminase